MTRSAGLAPLLALAAAISGCAPQPASLPPAPATALVPAIAETEPVGTPDQDAADDPAIWHNPADPAQSLIVATDKKAGLYVYGLDGQRRSFLAAGHLNNVDLIDRGPHGVLVVASDRNDLASAKLQLYRLDGGAGTLLPLGAVSGGAGEAYGVCLWQAADAIYAFSVLKHGAIHQVRITMDGAAPQGEIVRLLKLPTQTEGCVVDPRTALLYVGEENVGIWRFGAAANESPVGSLVAKVDARHLVADVEGLAIAPDGPTGGYLVASSQGDNSFALYSLPDMTPSGRFRVPAGTVGSVEETDGIAVTLSSLGPDYPRGLLVVQDGANAPHAQNFKLVSWAEVERALGLTSR
ncbi:MAG TPA: phytase [Sphingomicrobium sp.]|nr:phytase [Sphingomicrobium sp.]